jgi:hypothetical protein
MMATGAGDRQKQAPPLLVFGVPSGIRQSTRRLALFAASRQECSRGVPQRSPWRVAFDTPPPAQERLMAEPTTDEMIAWCERLAEASEAAARERDKAMDELGALLGLGHTYQARMFRAIAARLRTPPAAGLAHEPPTYEAAPGNVAMPVFGRKDEER